MKLILVPCLITITDVSSRLKLSLSVSLPQSVPSSRLTSVSRVLVCACHTRRSSKNSLPTVQQILQTHQQMASD